VEPVKRELNPRTLWISFVAILILGTFLRVYRLAEVPLGFFRDEADKGYSAYSLLRTGRDLEGRAWPLQIRSLRVYTSPIYQWAAIPFVAGGGLDEGMVRLPAAVVGSLTILAVFLLGRRLLGDPGGLVAAFLLAVSPWHLPLSRWANQGVFVPFFLSLAVYFYLKFPLTPTLSLRGRGRSLATLTPAPLPGGEGSSSAPLGKGGRGDLRRWLPGIVAGLLFFCALFSYAPAKVFVPLFLAVLTLLSLRSGGWKWKASRPEVWLSFLALALPLAIYTALSWNEAGRRVGAVWIFSPGKGFVESIGDFLRGYLKHLSPAFLFLSGDSNPRHSVPGWGQLYHMEICLVVLGLVSAIRRRSWSDQVLLVWIVAALMPAALTREGLPHALRSVAAIPALALISASGLLYLWELTEGLRNESRWGHLPAVGLSLVILAESVTFTVTYFGKYPSQTYPYWEYGYREAVRVIEQHRRPGEEVFVRPVSDYAEVHFLFYGAYPPEEYQAGHFVKHINFLTAPHGEAMTSQLGPGLVLVFPWDRVAGTPLATITAPDGSPIWRLIRVEAPSS
jgi:4-amino-4-deoxy-L-arabinose transferase-like glycosyltransferase